MAGDWAGAERLPAAAGDGPLPAAPAPTGVAMPPSALTLLNRADGLLGEIGRRMHRFSWLRQEGAPIEECLLVDAYYPGNRIVLLIGEQTEEERALCEREVPAHGLRLLVLSTSDYVDEPGQITARLQQVLREVRGRPIPLPAARVRASIPGSGGAATPPARAPQRPAPTPAPAARPATPTSPAARTAPSVRPPVTPRPAPAAAPAASPPSENEWAEPAPRPRRHEPLPAPQERRLDGDPLARAREAAERITNEKMAHEHLAAVYRRKLAPRSPRPGEANEDEERAGMLVGGVLCAVVFVELLVLMAIVGFGGGHTLLGFGFGFDAAARAIGTIAYLRADDGDRAWTCLFVGSPAIVSMTLFSENESPPEPAPLAGWVGAVGIALIVLGAIAVVV